ncbi:MAG: hypothetical protein ACI9XU_001749 [Arenicella sp.]|jgi:hypothetical protein|tara:strand:+ start:69 stop:338 length:270 start_codon:yes stop_codon:yes gene_type:complete
MTRVISLEDIKIESLSIETLEWLSQLTVEILKTSGKGFVYNDPFILPKIRSRVKKLKDPMITELYFEFKEALKKSVNSGQFQVRMYSGL